MFTAMIIGLAGVSLFVGGVGILSIMLITVRERVGEIGLRMAIGARPRDILVQFLSEALILGTGGGVLGLALGLGSARAIHSRARAGAGPTRSLRQICPPGLEL